MSENVDGTLIHYFKELIKTESQEDLKKFGMGIAAVVFTCIVLYYASIDPTALTENFYTYFFFGLFPIVVVAIILSNIFAGNINQDRMYLYVSILFLFIMCIYLFRQIINPSSSELISYLMRFLAGLILIIGLAIVYRVFVRIIVNTRGWLGFFLRCIFLIPCLLIDLFETVFEELKKAPKMVVVLFILEIVIILTYIYMVPLSKYSQNSQSVVLLNEPTFLTRVKYIGRASDLFMDVNDVNNPSNDMNKIRQSYAVSMWIYLNSHPNTYAAYSKETNIFRYGYPTSLEGHPRVSYFNDTKNTKNSDNFIVYANGSDDSGVRLNIPTQSWNQLVISYNGNSVDIYVNGNLEKTVKVKKRTSYDTGDVIEVGEGDNTVTGGGLHGAICNVVYYKHSVTPFQIATDYNLNRYKNPPVHLTP